MDASMLGPNRSDSYEQDLFERVARSEQVAWSDVTADLLQQIAVREGVDFATAWLYQRLRDSPVHGPWIERLDQETILEIEKRRPDATVVIVPGAFYREFPQSGADGKLIRMEAERLGFATDLVPLMSLGSLQTNVGILRDWLERDWRGNLILVSLSKGGAEVKMALGEPHSAQTFAKVAFWVNLSGLLQGTPLVSWLLSSRLRTLWFRLLFWWRGYDFSVIPELDRGPGTPLDREFRVPNHMRAIHVVGFPLAGHLTNSLARRCYRRIRAWGPNDGAGIILADVCRLPGLIYPVWGADHYLRPAGRDIASIARQLLIYIRRDLERRAKTPLSASVSKGEPCTTASSVSC
jgi:hypothetical protein